MNYLHVFLARGPVEIDKVAGGIERVCMAWYNALHADSIKRENQNHYLFSMTHEEKESLKLHDNHLLSKIPCGKKGRRKQIGEEMQEITNQYKIDVIVNHTFSDGLKVNAACEMVRPYNIDAKLHLINIVHLHGQLCLVEAPFITQKVYFRDPETYAPKNPFQVNTVFLTNSKHSEESYTMGCENPEMPAIPINFADFGKGFFSFVNDDKKLPVLESNGDIILIGRADSMKRLPETLKYLLEYDKGNIHVFTKSNDRVNGIINRLNKMAKDLDHVFIHNDAPRNEMFEIMRHAKCFISGSYKETGPSTMIEAGEYGVPSILGHNNNFNQGYPATTILQDVNHFHYNIDMLKDNPQSLLDVVDIVPTDMDYRNKIQADIMSSLGITTLPDKWYKFIDDIVDPDNHNKYCNTSNIIKQTETLF